jgi:hypothetical protein
VFELPSAPDRRRTIVPMTSTDDARGAVPCECSSITRLDSNDAESYVDGHLQLVASDEAAWTDDYVCPQTGARWRRSWPHSELHGGGPSRLDRLAGRAAEGQVAVISLAIHDRDERPLFAYRTEPEKPHDSGWTLTAGESHEEIRQARLGVAHLHHLVERFPQLANVFADDRVDSAWEWDADTGRYRDISLPDRPG